MYCTYPFVIFTEVNYFNCEGNNTTVIMALGPDLAELSRHLRQERLFVSSEREKLLELYEQVQSILVSHYIC